MQIQDFWDWFEELSTEETIEGVKEKVILVDEKEGSQFSKLFELSYRKRSHLSLPVQTFMPLSHA